MQATGGDVWHGSHALGLYLQDKLGIVAGKRVLELGSGTGYLGLVAAALAAKEVFVSDRAVMVPLMKANIDRNRRLAGVAKPLELDWCGDIDAQLAIATSTHPLDVVLGADLIYEFAEKGALVQVLCKACSASTKVYLSQSHREGNEQAFFAAVSLHFFVEDVTAEYRCVCSSELVVVLLQLFSLFFLLFGFSAFRP